MTLPTAEAGGFFKTDLKGTGKSPPRRSKQLPVPEVLQLRLLSNCFRFLSPPQKPDRYAPHSAIICPLSIPHQRRISPLPGFLRTRMIPRVDGCSYLLLELYQKLTAVETATDLSPCLKPGACVSFFGQERKSRSLNKELQLAITRSDNCHERLL